MRDAMIKRIEAQNREDLYEERAGIMEHDGGLKKLDAERLARAGYPRIATKEAR